MSSIRRYLLRGAGWSAAVQVVNIALSFSVSILLARLLGVAGYGTYQFTMAWVALLGTLAGFGLARVVERELAASKAIGDWSRIKGLIRFGYVSALMISGTVALLLLAFLLGFGRDESSLLAIAALLLPIQAVSGVVGAIQLGFKQVVRSSLPHLLHISSFALLIGSIWVFMPTERSLEPSEALYLQVATASVALAIGILLVSVTYRSHRQLAPVRPSYDVVSWLRAGLPLMLITGMLTINNQADILMLGMMVGTEAVGMYHAATRIANFLPFLLAAAIIPMQPLIAEFNATKQHDRLQSMVTRSVRWIFFFTVPLAIPLIFFGHALMGGIYGPAFSGAALALALLSTAQLLVVATGPVKSLLIMSGNEKTVMLAVGLSTFLNVFLNSALIPFFGIEGAAAATGFSLIVWNFILIRQTERRVGVRPTIFGKRLSLLRLNRGINQPKIAQKALE